MHSEDSDQAGQMPRLIAVFAGCTCHFVGFVILQLSYHCSLQPIFRPPLDVYDILIFLNGKQLPRQPEAIDITTMTYLPTYGKTVEGDRFPVTDFDPVQMYLKELQVS